MGIFFNKKSKSFEILVRIEIVYLNTYIHIYILSSLCNHTIVAVLI